MHKRFTATSAFEVTIWSMSISVRVLYAIGHNIVNIIDLKRSCCPCMHLAGISADVRPYKLLIDLCNNCYIYYLFLENIHLYAHEITTQSSIYAYLLP